jgi:hypothetical protein
MRLLPRATLHSDSEQEYSGNTHHRLVRRTMLYLGTVAGFFLQV